MNPALSSPGFESGREAVRRVLRREPPSRIVYAPNYWQWFTHHRNHGQLPEAIRHLENQLDLIRHLGLDVFSRNLYCDPTRHWFGGLAEETWGSVEVEVRTRPEGRDTLTEKIYRTAHGVLTERLRYVFADSTLVQEQPLLDPEAPDLGAFENLVQQRRWQFNSDRYRAWQAQVGDAGLVHAGELFSPLKMLHLAAGADRAVFLLADHPARVREWMALHEAAQLDLVRQMLDAGVPSMIAMDNLDALFHPPHYVERCSASFYERASRLCHERGATFFIHACGRQKRLLPLVAALGVDGLEGVAFPPLGDVQLDEALRLAGERLIVTGGISAFETENFKRPDEVRRYVEGLLHTLRPYAHRFMLSASCNTSIRTPWEVLTWFRDAWREFGSLPASTR